MSKPKVLHINWEDLEIAFEDVPYDLEGSSQHPSYFDLETGQVIFLSDDICSALDQIEAELADQLPQDGEVTADAIRGADAFQRLPGWEQEVVLSALPCRFGDLRRFEEIPRFQSYESYEYMEDFIETVPDPSMRERLDNAIQQRKPFRRFRDVLAGNRRLEHQWRAYEHRRQHATILQWLHSIGVEPANPDESSWEPPPLPDLRKIMFAEVRRFVRFARDLPGVTRIALIGSLAQAKEFPRDVDLLVTVTDDCELAPLAKLGRELTGHMLARQAGADVFLADPDGHYLGRTCPWRECGPGIRRRCDALHCGQRHYLHDDLKAVRLNKKLIAHPPVILWPQPAAGDGVPPDVRDELIEPLARDQS